MNLHDKLDKMVGKVFMYKTNHHEILKVYESDDNITISTDKTLIVIPREKAKEEIEQFLPVQNNAKKTLVCTSKSRIENLVELVEENIKLVQQDTNNIPKAKSINDSIKNIIDIAKLELEAQKVLKSR